MVEMSEFAADDGLALAGRVARKEVSARELADAALAAIEKVNPQINAVLQRLPEEAAKTIAAGVPDGPFAGVPFLIKEVVLHAAGVASRAGAWIAAESAYPTDTELMARFRKAGFVTVGTTQTPEWGFNATTEPVRFGPARSPWDLNHSTGGSSGGSAAAVAAGIVPIAHANDGGGSIRIPAACCGVFGMKPTRMRTPSGPDNGDLLWGLAVEFAVSRSVRDSAALLDVISAPDPGAPHFPPHGAMSFTEALQRPRKGLKIAFSAKTPSGVPVDADCIEAVNDAAALCAALGHTVVEAAPVLDWEPYLEATLRMWNSFLAYAIDQTAAATGVPVGPETTELASLACWKDGRSLTASDMLAGLGVLNGVSRDFARFFGDYDVLLTPMLTKPPLPIGVLNQNAPMKDATQWGRQIFDYAAFTSQFNATGQPAMSVPLHWNKAGLPIGVQFAGRFGDEATLFGLAGELEAARPWMGRRPGVRA